MKSTYISLLITSVLFATVFSSCKKDEITTFNTIKIPGTNPISSDTIPAFAQGTLLTGKTYYITQDVTVKKGDTLYAQPGSIVIVKNNSQINIQGVLRLEGTKEQPIFFNSDKCRGL